MKAYELLEQKELCKGTFARDANGKPVSVYSPIACSFCAAGAIRRAYLDTMEEPQKLSLVGSHVLKLHDMTLAMWNDKPDTTKAQVVSLLKELDI